MNRYLVTETNSANNIAYSGFKKSFCLKKWVTGGYRTSDGTLWRTSWRLFTVLF